MTHEENHPQIEVHIAKDAPERAKSVAMNLNALFNGPSFKKKVLETVAEMLLEGKLEYDQENDTFDIPEDRVKKWAANMERKVWSKKRKSKISKK
jgi:hypothetical protein